VNLGRTRELLESGGDPSIWAAVAPRSSSLCTLSNDHRWRPLRSREGVALWTDDFSNIFSVLRRPWGENKQGRLAETDSLPSEKMAMEQICN
jgi:hypothetical protein